MPTIDNVHPALTTTDAEVEDFLLVLGNHMREVEAHEDADCVKLGGNIQPKDTLFRNIRHAKINSWRRNRGIVVKTAKGGQP